jgi:adenine phosphoribosyltransferase
MTTTDKLSFLQQKFLDAAFVKDAKSGYIVVKEFNIRIDPDVLQFASRCWADHYHHDTHIDAVVGLPDAGSRLVSILAEMLRVEWILPSKRTPVIPGAWEDVISYSNRSFTTGQDDVMSHIGFVKKGMRVLLVDDVVAHGSTAMAAISALQRAGVEVVGLCVLFDKRWQHGTTEIKTKTGVEVYSLIGVKKITAKGTILLV